MMLCNNLVMRSPRDLCVNTYLGRLAVYSLAAGAASLIASLSVNMYGYWKDPGLMGPIYMVAFSLGAPLLIVAIARLSVRGVIAIGALAAAGMAVMWWMFASSESSTSALAFVLGWFVGIPAAVVIAAVANFRAGRAGRERSAELAGDTFGR